MRSVRKQALRDNGALQKGLNIVDGKITHQAVAAAFGAFMHDAGAFL